MDCETINLPTNDEHLIAEPSMEHRWGRRIPCHARVRISGGGGATGAGRMRDVSMSGAFIETATPLPLFSPLAIAVIRDDGVDDAELAGCVVRCDPDGIAIEWSEVLPGPVCPLLGCRVPCAAACA